MDNFRNKDLLKHKAEAHIKEMEGKYAAEISECFNNTKFYENYSCERITEKETDTQFVVDITDTVSAVMYHKEGKTCVLNSASYLNPGGGFTEGIGEQEEMLCHESILYNVLRLQMKFYTENRRKLNSALYLNRGLYTPNVVFEHREEIAIADVITLAAPNKGRAKKYNNVTDEQNTAALRERMDEMFVMAVDNSVDTLILGAWGCGEFKQDPDEVAALFKEYLTWKYKNCFQKVVFVGTSLKDIAAFEKNFALHITRPKEEYWN